MSFYQINQSSKKKRAEQLVDKDPDGKKQYEKVSDHSPSAVEDSEFLARSLEYPSKFNTEGGLNDSLFQDAYTHGASAQRLLNGWESHRDDVHDRFEARAMQRRTGTETIRANPEFTYIGAFLMKASDVRKVVLDDEKLFRVRVYDAGESANDSLHAEIVADTRLPESEIKSVENPAGLEKIEETQEEKIAREAREAKQIKQIRHMIRVKLMYLAQQKGLFLSPHLSDENYKLAENTGCELKMPGETIQDHCVVSIV